MIEHPTMVVPSTGTNLKTLREASGEKIAPRAFTPKTSPSRYGIGRVAPLILLVWFCSEVALRFTPPEWLRLRPVLAAIRFPRPYAPFEPDLQVRTEQFTGEAALEGNLPTQEQRPPIRFSTDHLGFRLNPYLTDDQAPEVLVWRGASFTYGASLSDEETFPAQLTRVAELRTYNGGRFYSDPDGLPELDWLLARLPRRPHTTVYMHLEHEELGAPPVASTRLLGIDVQNPRESLNLRYAYGRAQIWQRLSPFDVIFTRLFKSVSDDRIMPNPYRHNVSLVELPDGTKLLMRRYETKSAAAQRDDSYIRRRADHLTWLQGQLKSRGMNAVIVLLPSRQTVYQPWLKGFDGQEAPARSYLDRLERELAAREVPSVNGLTVFRKGIEREVSTGILSFYRDDNHWNPQGVRLIAGAVAAALNTPVSYDTASRIRSQSRTPHAVQ